MGENMSKDGLTQMLWRAFNPASGTGRWQGGSAPLWQGLESVIDYTIRFRKLATDNRWNTAALTDVFLKGNTERIQDLLILMDLPSDLDSLIALAVRTNQQIWDRHHHPAVSATLHHSSPSANENPVGLQSQLHKIPMEEKMQLSWAKLMPEETRRAQQWIHSCKVTVGSPQPGLEQAVLGGLYLFFHVLFSLLFPPFSCMYIMSVFPLYPYVCVIAQKSDYLLVCLVCLFASSQSDFMFVCIVYPSALSLWHFSSSHLDIQYTYIYI